jgi:transcriptional regulator with XRE-family HTH domain
MTLISRLFERFRAFGYRHSYVDSFLDSYIATQIKVLREQRKLTQAKLAQLAGMHQSQVAGLEDVNNSSWKISTLKKLARAFDLVLVVRFESFGKVLPDIDTFGRPSLERASFDDDPVFAPSVVLGATAYIQASSPIDDPIENAVTLSAGTVRQTATYFPGQVRQRVA